MLSVCSKEVGNVAPDAEVVGVPAVEVVLHLVEVE
jgi:hypothetical protein